MTPLLSRSRALFAILALAAQTARAQAVLGPAEDATVAPVGVLRFRIAYAWEHWDAYAASADTSASAYVQVRVTPVSVEMGILNRFSATFIAPGVGTLATGEWSSMHGPVSAVDSFTHSSHNGLGDLELGAKFAWLAGPSEVDRIALGPGLHLRSALSAFYRFPTGEADDPTDPFDVGTGSQRAAVTAASQTDLMFGHVFWISAVGRYGWPQPVTRPVQVRPPGLPLSAAYPLTDATETGGNFYSIELTPRVVLGRYFSLGAQYAYVHRDASSFTGVDTLVNGVDTTLVDASTLNGSTAGTAQYWSASATYSTIAAYMQGKTSMPIEISFTHTGTLSATGALPPNMVTNTVTFRLWLGLWGAHWKHGMAAKP